ncbi:MAG: WxL protein peptidoglycan domain-containing protein [Candidatus Microsaccharimonas sp.]
MLVNSRVLKSVRVAVGLIVAVVILAVAHSFAVQAQGSANTLKITPLRTDLTVEPGKTGIVEVTVTNLTDEEIMVRPIQNDFIQGSAEDGTPSLILDADEYAPTHSLKRFMSPMEDVTIPANEGKTIEVAITVPAGAQAGGYFGAVRFAPTTPDSGGQVNLSASVASLILLTVPGPVEETLKLTSFELVQGGKAGTDFRSPNDLKLAFRFENKGNIQLAPFGKISVSQGDEVIYDYDFNTKDPRDMILPDGARKWEVPLENIGEFGHYTVNATFSYGSKNQTIDIERSFWVIPTAYIIAAIVAILLLVGLIVWLIFFLRGRKRRMARRSGRRRR